MTDIRLGLRMLAKSPASALLITGLLALGIGATTVMFTVFDAVLVRPLPVSYPEELVRIVQRHPRIGTVSDFPFRYYEVLRDHARALANTLGESASRMGFRFTLTAPRPAKRSASIR